MANPITPNLWFEGNAPEAVEFYTSVFDDGKIVSTTNYPHSKEEGLADFQLDLAGKPLVIEFEAAGQKFAAINAGPEFKPTPAISFFLNFDPSRDDNAREHLDAMWAKLSEGGEALMPLQEYPFSKHYGWIKDRFGYSWQLILTNPDGDPRPFIVPSFMFCGPVQNQCAEAMEYYLSVFKDSKKGVTSLYEEPNGTVEKGSVMFADFMLSNQWFAAMDSGGPQPFTFNEAISLQVDCVDQAEIDYFWDKLSADPASEQCGWCKDKYGVSWQIVPAKMGELMQRPNAFAKLMEMHKIVIADF